MTNWKEVARFMYGDVSTSEGFWYSHVLRELHALTEEQLFWLPGEKALPIIWHVGHIAHRERIHLGQFLQGIEHDLIPPQFEVFGPDWCSVVDVRKSIESVESVFAWVREVREQSRKYIESLSGDDFYSIPEFTEYTEGMSVAHWLFITAAHAALHIGRIQLLRAMIEDEKERAC